MLPRTLFFDHEAGIEDPIHLQGKAWSKDQEEHCETRNEDKYIKLKVTLRCNAEQHIYHEKTKDKQSTRENTVL